MSDWRNSPVLIFSDPFRDYRGSTEEEEAWESESG